MRWHASITTRACARSVLSLSAARIPAMTLCVKIKVEMFLAHLVQKLMRVLSQREHFSSHRNALVVVRLYPDARVDPIPPFGASSGVMHLPCALLIKPVLCEVILSSKGDFLYTPIFNTTSKTFDPFSSSKPQYGSSPSGRRFSSLFLFTSVTLCGLYSRLLI